MSVPVSPASKTSARTPHPNHPAPAWNSGGAAGITVNRPGQAPSQAWTGTQTGGTKEGEVFPDFC